MDSLRLALKTARKAWRAEKKNQELKKAYKAAKVAYESAQGAKGDTGKGRYSALSRGRLRSVFRKAWKASGKSDDNLKKALKKAKKKLEAMKSKTVKFEQRKRKRSENTSVPIEKNKKKRDLSSCANERKREGTETSKEGLTEAKIFVGNCSYQITDDEIHNFFKDCGKIQEVYWVCNKSTGRFSGMGFVTFMNPESAQRALKLNEQECMGRRLKIRLAKPYKKRIEKPKDKVNLRSVKPLSERPDECYTVFVGNLSYSVTDELMREFAEEKSGGSVTAIRWITDRATDEFKGAGYVEFDTTKAVDEFVKQNGEFFMSRQMRVDFAKPKY